METGGCGSRVDGGSILLLTKSQQPPCSINLHFTNSLFPWKFKNPNFHSSYYCYHCRNNRWDSNAEAVGSYRFKFKNKNKDKNKKESENDDVEEEEEGSRRKEKKRRWWSDEPPENMNMEEEEQEEAEVLEEFIESIWIFKVFKSYGWALPPIILSWLVATGPKAFFMVLAIPLGQSTLTFLLQKLLGRTKSKPKGKARKKKKPSTGTLTDAEITNERQEEKQGTVKAKTRYQSWVVDDNGSVNKNSQDMPNFVGWDELDRMESMQRPPRMAGSSQRIPLANSKLSKRGSKSDIPLLLRLLIAVFPFLGSWTKML